MAAPAPVSLRLAPAEKAAPAKKKAVPAKKAAPAEKAPAKKAPAKKAAPAKNAAPSETSKTKKRCPRGANHGCTVFCPGWCGRLFTLEWSVPKNKVHPQYEFVSGQTKRKMKVTNECWQWHDQSGVVKEVQTKSIKGREERVSAPLNDDGSEKRRTSSRNDASATVPSGGRDCLDVNDMASDQLVLMQQDRGNVNVLAVFLAAKLERSTIGWVA